MIVRLISLIALSFAVLAAPVVAEDAIPTPKLQMPIDCELGWNCWIANYVDHDRTKEAKDYSCKGQTYNAHKGTDFMIRTERDMQAGVVVTAAADGVVLGARDGMKDIDYRKRDRQAIAKKECGNGLRLRHKDGWVTQYCHLKRNSLKVQKGDKVHAGDILGLVGNSGLSIYPHLHFQVEYLDPKLKKRRGAIVDPFVGVARNDLCEEGDNPLWLPEVLSQLDYDPVNIIDTGFAATKPKTSGMAKGLYDDETLSIRSPKLFLWARMLHVKQGDKVTFSITDPFGKEIFTYTSEIEKTQAHRGLYAGMRRPSLNWEKGVYKGEIKLLRQTDGSSGGIFKSETRISMR
ncbi:M23 family metallopeptidase [Terasakiella sp. A23]|uniref:M23 family metallopeptidase n=1 Tax=Terasakiella sp. FCG-A23 TaxID=3080561 RepID=UPI0029559B01|nr:M23 family metallopeptidase [Terasakiella sp. A23]MDV7339711.1 M23 family metallopeptidase [Terasakiella sp. A23]